MGGDRRRIAFYAPLKSPNHPAPSGDRAMARLLMRALDLAGYDVSLASDLRTFLRDPDDAATHGALVEAAAKERKRLKRQWGETGPPDLWVSYHPYYKSPDLLGPPLCEAHNVPWVTFEASQSIRRSVGCWADFQARALEAAQGARVNVSFTARDIEGLHEVDPGLPVTRLTPFIDEAPFLALAPNLEPGHLVTIAMMRGGQKFESFQMLANALSRLGDLDWHLTVVGDGPERAKVQDLFAPLPKTRLTWAGQCDAQGVRDVLARGWAFVWPGVGEAFGVAYLEAQAAGLPVIAQRVAGVPEVVSDGETGLLAPGGEEALFSDAIRRVLVDRDLQGRLSRSAREKIRREHGLEAAAERLASILSRYVWNNTT